MAKTITIPHCRNPFRVIIGAVEYAYPAGSTVEVPDAVAAVIEHHVNLQPKEDPNAGKVTGGVNKLPQILDRTVTELTEEDLQGITKIGAYVFYSCASLTNAYLPDLTHIGEYAFSNCQALASVNFPNATNVDSYAFNSCLSLVNANIPNVTTTGTHALANCRVLENANLPNITQVNNYLLYGCYKLSCVDFSKATDIGANAFRDCYSLKAVILRSGSICTLGGTTVFQNCYHILGTRNTTYNPNGDKDGYIYVPSALVDSYKAATNWSTYASQFRALEDYTVDGTITGALDESKI